MTLKEAIQIDGQRHLYVKSAVTSGTTQYIRFKHIETGPSCSNELVTFLKYHMPSH